MNWNSGLPEAAHILRGLIDAASPNPPGDCEAVSRVCVAALASEVPDVRVVRAPDGTPSVLASLGHGDRTLLIHSHYDTQPAGDPAAWDSDPYRATLRDGAIYGRGAGDDKGSVAAQMAALLRLAREGFDPVYGARPLKRFLQHQLESRIARAILSGEFGEGSTVRVEARDGKLSVELAPAAAPAVTSAA